MFKHRVRTLTADLTSVGRNCDRATASSEQPLMVLNDCPVALTGCRLKPSAVEYQDFATGIADHLVFLQYSCRVGHGASLYAQHVSQVLVSEMEMIGVGAVVSHQQ